MSRSRLNWCQRALDHSFVLPVEFAKIGDEVAALFDAGVDRIRWEQMDGMFVLNLT